MARIPTVLIALGLLLSAVSPEDSKAQIHRSTLHDYRVVPVASDLQNPWGIAFLPGGDILITERPGRLRIVREGRLLPDPVPGVPEVLAQGQGGLMDVQPHPDFAANRLIYITYSKAYTDHIEFISALRSVLVCPEVAGHGVEGETLWVTVPVAPDFPEGPSCAHERVVCRNTTVIV